MNPYVECKNCQDPCSVYERCSSNPRPANVHTHVWIGEITDTEPPPESALSRWKNKTKQQSQQLLVDA